MLVSTPWTQYPLGRAAPPGRRYHLGISSRDHLPNPNLQTNLLPGIQYFSGLSIILITHPCE